MKPVYRTHNGVQYLGNSEEILSSKYFKKLKNKINLIFTSPPFPLNKKKAYGNLTGDEYLDWLSQFGTVFKELLSEDGSLVIEIGNAWIPKKPVMSFLPIESLLELTKIGDFKLCQEFIWYNPSKLPSPIQWVNIERSRVKDSFTRLWWLSKTDRPKANNRNVLIEYSPSMKKLLDRQNYNHGRRPSEHIIGEKSFLKNNGGAIPSNVLIYPNTVSNDPYLNYCRINKIKYHPARMPIPIAEFFIKFLTEKKDIILDPFSGSNVTGFSSEINDRRWRSIELNNVYATSSKARFKNAWFI